MSKPKRVSVDDLMLAAQWLRSYEPAPEEDASWTERVAAKLEGEAMAREDKMQLRAMGLA
jgi:hypothetical protein